MEKPILNNPDIVPDDSVLAQHLGRAKAVWDTLIEEINRKAPFELVPWKFYNDGKSWLTRVVKKKKTLCWISVWEKHFKVSFYFTNASRDSITITSAIDDNIKTQWSKQDKNKKYQVITIIAKKKSDVKIIAQMMDVKADLV